VENQQSCVHANSANIASDHIQLFLEWRYFFGLGFNGREDLTLGGQLTDDDGEEPALTLLNLRTGEEHWRRNVVRASRAVLLFLVQFLPFKALCNVLFLQVIGLARERGLIREHAVCFNADAVHGHVHTVHNFYDIAHLNILFMHNFFNALSPHGNNFRILSNLLLLQELTFFFVV
jgi:hypothetical protein